jgi:hypothetical protein
MGTKKYLNENLNSQTNYRGYNFVLLMKEQTAAGAHHAMKCFKCTAFGNQS